MKIIAPLIGSVYVLNISGMSQDKVRKKIEDIEKKKKEDELYLLTTLDIKTKLETLPEGQILTITIDDVKNVSEDEISDLLNSLASLRDYYEDLTVTVVDNTEKISIDNLPEDTIVKKN